MASFDIVSKVPWHEVDNALGQSQKEIAQRYDFKDTGTELEKTSEGLVIKSSSEDRAKAALTVLQEKLIKNQRQGHTLQPLPTASPRGQARDPTRYIDEERFVFRPE